MELAIDDATRRMGQALRGFVDEVVRPAEPVYREQLAAQDDPWHWTAPPVLGELRSEARELGLWNLFLPGDEGAGLTGTEYALLARLVARSPLGLAATNCSTPDTGVMTALSRFGTAAQRRRWLDPLLDARVRSAVALAPAGTRIARDGDEYVVSGVQPSVPGALNPDVRIFVVAGETDPDAAGRRSTLVLVPRCADGLTVRRARRVAGLHPEALSGGLASLVLDEVRVPVSNLLGEEGDARTVVRRHLAPDRGHRRTG